MNIPRRSRRFEQISQSSGQSGSICVNLRRTKFDYLEARVYFVFLIALLSCGSAKNSGNLTRDVITVMSYNVHHCNPPSKPGVIDLDTIAAVIRNAGADLVALQEMDVNTGRSGKIDQVQLLAQKAGYPYYFFGRAIDFDGGQYGIAILSKHKLSNTAVHALPTEAASNGERRALALAEVSLPNGKQIVFGSTHLDALDTSINRLLQVKEIIRLTDAIKLPVIIAGDFNANEESEVVRLLDHKYVRTCQSCAPTFPDEGARAIDFIIHEPGKFSAVSHRVIKENYASDHYPIVSELRWKN